MVQETAPSQDFGGVGFEFGRARGYYIHGDGGGGRERKWRWFNCQAHSASPATIGFLPGAGVKKAQESRAETPRLQRGQKVSQTISHPVRVLGSLCSWQSTEIGSHWLQRTWQRGSGYLWSWRPVEVVANSAKIRCGVWVGFEMTPGTDSRSYYTVHSLDRTVIQ